MLRFFLKLICYLPLKLLFWTKWLNRQELKKYRGQPVIFAVNHRSGMDAVMMVLDIWRPSSFWAKSELFKPGFSRWFFQQLGAIPVKPGTELALIRASKQAFQKKRALILMPEGHRALGSEALQIRHGVALVALHAGVPIIPITSDRRLQPFRLTRFKVGTALDSRQFLVDGRVTKEAITNLGNALQAQMQQMLDGFAKKVKLPAWQTEPNLIARGIVIRDNQLLAIARNKGGEDYYVLPGGHTEPGESIQETCAREVLEETGVTVRPFRALYKYWYVDKHRYRGDGWQTFFVCEYLSGEPHRTDAEEYTQPNRITGTYNPLWLNLADLAKLDVRPAVMKKQLLKDYKKKGARLPLPLRRLQDPKK